MIVKKIEENLGLRDGTIRLLGIWDTRLPRGTTITPHMHEAVEEIYYILDGNGIMKIDNEMRAVSAGEVIYIPPKMAHSLAQAGEIHLRFLTVSIDVTGAQKEPQAPSYVA